MRLVTDDDIAAAAARIEPHVLRTPLLDSERLSSELGCRVLLKAENLQRTGSFKPRGACNALLSWREHGDLPGARRQLLGGQPRRRRRVRGQGARGGRDGQHVRVS